MSEAPAFWQHRLIVGLCVLLAVALVGGTTGSWVYRSIRQREAVEALILGPDNDVAILVRKVWPHNAVQYDYELDDQFGPTGDAPRAPEWLRERLGIDFFATVRGARLELCGGNSLRMLAEFPDLRVLEIRGLSPDDDLRLLAESPDLEKLAIRNLMIAGGELAILPRLGRLRMLAIDCCLGISDADLDSISQCAGLTQLTLVSCGVLPNAGVAKLGRLKNLESLNLYFIGDWSTDDVLQKFSGLDRLRHLTLDYGIGYEPTTGLKYLGGLSHLETLALVGITDVDLAAAAVAPTVKTLNLSPGRGFSGAGLENLKAFPNLEMLYLTSFPQFDDATLAHIARLAKLRELHLHGELAGLTDEGITHLAELKRLKRLQITFDPPGQVSSAAIDQLRDKLPDCRIECKGSPAP